MKTTQSLNFSVIIPTKNRVQQLLKLLFSIEQASRQYESKIQVIVVDNNSTDQTFDLIKKYSKQKLKIDLLVTKEKKIGPSFARNKGITLTNYQKLIFVDDDCLIPKNFFNLYDKAWKKYPNAKIIGGKVNVKKTNQKPLNKNEQELLEKHSWCFGYLNLKKTRKIVFGECLYGANFSYHHENSKEKVFNEKLGKELTSGEIMYGEDLELCGRTILKGQTAIYLHHLAVTNFIDQDRFNKEYLFKRHWKAGIENYAIDQIHRNNFAGYRSSLPQQLKRHLRNLLIGSPMLFEHIRTRYDLVFILSYFFNGKVFYKNQDN